MSKKVSLGLLAAHIATVVVAYAAGEIPAGSLAPARVSDVRRAPSFMLADKWVLPKFRYCAATLAEAIGVKCDQTFRAALDLLAAHEAGIISQDVFNAIVSGEQHMTVIALRDLAKDIR